jgi:uncharacterized protein (DUF433 family)/DNA-binding transcriptional MerR regulator
MADLLASSSGCYSAARAAALSGVPKSTVYDWARKGVVVPSVSPVQEKLWSFQDLLVLRAVQWLRRRKEGVPASPMPQVRAALEQTVKDGRSPWSDPNVRITVDLTGRIFVDEASGEPRDVHGQSIWEFNDRLDLLGAFDHGLHLVSPTEHITIRPSRLSGEPHLKDTRITTLGLASLAADGYESRQIAELFELPVDRVEEAIDYEARLAA